MEEGPDFTPLPPKRIGLYTSPHLKRVQESYPDQLQAYLSRKTFFRKVCLRRYVWEGYFKVQYTACRSLDIFSYLLMLVSVHTFVRESVDAGICETHDRGEYDATDNVLKPVVTGNLDYRDGSRGTVGSIH